MSEDLFREFWWLMFPIVGMVRSVIGCLRDNAREDAIVRDARARLERDQ